VDFNEKMINIARETLVGVQCQKEFIREDFFKIKLSAEYDLVHSQGVIEHFTAEKRLELLKLHAQATKPGGYCLIYAPTPTRSYCFFRKMAEILRAWPFTDEIPLTKNVIINEMQSLGFTLLKTNYFWPYLLTEVGIIFQKRS
jgi:cyclopropane fatty-acyl-phospholipid synthase-like methyltransferase